MNDINGLLEALKLSPNNLPLRLHIVSIYMNAQQYEEAIYHLNESIKTSDDNAHLQVLLAECYYHIENYSTAIVIFENCNPTNNSSAYKYYCLSLYKEGAIEEAKKHYQLYIDQYPNDSIDELDDAFRTKSEIESVERNEKEVFTEKSDITFKDVGGMHYVKKQIDLKILKPLKHPELYKAYGKKSGGGILLYGPPGCGKTYIAKATAGEMEARFISISINQVLSQWQGESEKILNDIFESARQHTPCVLFIDEIDALASKRSDLRNNAGKSLVNQLLSEMDGLSSNNEGVLIIGATNVPWHLDPAIMRPGRFDRLIFIPPPDAESREAILNIHLREKPTGKIKLNKLVKQTKDFSGADLRATVDTCIEAKLEEAFEKNKTINIETDDLFSAVKKHKPIAVTEWLKTARNYAVYANESGLYNEILDFINKK